MTSAGDHPTVTSWRGWLTDVTLSVPDPAAALSYWAELLGSTASGDSVALGSGTMLHASDGTPGLGTATLVLNPNAGQRARATMPEGKSRDPDGRELVVVDSTAVPELASSPDPRLGHLTFMSPDPVGVQRYYEGLGFRLSEGLADFFRWIRCNPIHHTLAFSRSEAPALHHVGIELPDRVALVDAADRLHEAGHTIEYGPGRHFVGNNIFIYFRDRHGIRFELFCELERISDRDRDGPIHTEVPREKSINLWGPQPPPTFLEGT